MYSNFILSEIQSQSDITFPVSITAKKFGFAILCLILFLFLFSFCFCFRFVVLCETFLQMYNVIFAPLASYLTDKVSKLSTFIIPSPHKLYFFVGKFQNVRVLFQQKLWLWAYFFCYLNGCSETFKLFDILLNFYDLNDLTCLIVKLN